MIILREWPPNEYLLLLYDTSFVDYSVLVDLIGLLV